MTKRRDFLKAGGAALASLPILSALGVSSASASSGKLSIYSNLTGSKQAAADALYAAFKAANPGVEIEVTVFGDVASSHTKLQSAIAAGVVPDLVINHYYLAPVYARGNHILELTDDVLAQHDIDLSQLDPRFVPSGEWEGKRISLPMFASSRTLMYNNTALTEVGLSAATPPKDWEELRTWAKALTKRDGDTLVRAGLALNVPPGEYGENLFALLLWGAGGELLSADGKTAAFNSDAGRAAVEFWHSLIHDDKVYDIGFTGPGGNNPFMAQTAALTYGLNPIAMFSARDGLDFGSVPIPAKDGGSISMLDPFSYYVMRKGPNTDLALQFIAFANTPEQQTSFGAATYSLPALTEAQSAPEIVGLKQLTPFVDALKVAHPLPVTPHYTAMWESISRNVEEALTNSKPIDAALAAAETEVNRILSR
jgi:multiple sugar transport system substrate-binding protein